MKILVDEVPVLTELADAAYPEIHKAVILHANSLQRTIVVIKADGKEIPNGPELPEEIQEPFIETLEVSTLPTREVAASVLQGCGEQLSVLYEGINTVVAELRAGNPPEAMNTLCQAVDMWIEIANGAESAMTVAGLDWNTVEVEWATQTSTEKITAMEVIQKMNALLEDIQTAMENSDHVELIDILEYDLPAVLKSYQQAVFAFKDLADRPLN